MSNLSAFQAKSWIGETREYLCVISTRNVRLLFREDDTYTVLCFPRIMAYEYDPINHPAWIFGAEIYDVSPLSVQALCKLFSSRHLPSRGETCPPPCDLLSPPFLLVLCSSRDRPPRPRMDLSNYCRVTTKRSLFYYTLWIITSVSSLRIIYRGQRCGVGDAPREFIDGCPLK